MNLKKNNKIFYLVILIGILLRVFYIFQFDDYLDDWNFFYTVDSEVSDKETWQRHFYGSRGDYILKEAFPWSFTYFTKYFLKIVGYSVENTHYLILTFSILSLFLIYKFCDLISNNFKLKILILILFSTNLFLIRELNSFRPHSLSIFLSILSSYFFILIFLQNKTQPKYLSIYIISTFFVLTIWPQNLAFFAGHCLFLFFIFLKKRTDFLFYSFAPITITSLYILLNFKYIQYVAIDNSWSYTPIELTFFVNFFFRSFFGSIIFGAFMLLIFSFFLIKEIKEKLNEIKNKKNLIKIPFFNLNIENFILTNILTIYSLSITYSLLRESVLAPKYFIVLIPLIIIWISLKICSKKNLILYNITILFVLLNTLYYWNDIPIKRPPMREALKIISDNNFKKIYTTEDTVFNNYLSHYNFSIKNNLEISKLSNLKKNIVQNNFTILCMNYPRYAVGDHYKDKEHKTCIDIAKNENFNISKKIKIDDFIIYFVNLKL